FGSFGSRFWIWFMVSFIEFRFFPKALSIASLPPVAAAAAPPTVAEDPPAAAPAPAAPPAATAVGINPISLIAVETYGGICANGGVSTGIWPGLTFFNAFWTAS